MHDISALLIVCFLSTLMFAGSAIAQTHEPQTVNLYPGEVPGQPVYDGEAPDENTRPNGHVEFVHTPTLTVYRPDPELANGACVVICPGGGYRILAIQHEGVDVARWLNASGTTAVVLKYRMYPYRHPVPMMDVQRAMQTTRANAEAWGIDPHRVGVLGFSAGGHLASTASTHILEPDHDSDDPVLRHTSRPDFAVLLYPVISTSESYTHRGSANNLLGAQPDPALADLMSNDKQVTEDTPPTLLVHSRDDTAVPIKNSQAYLAALHAHKVPGTLIEFGTGGHGYGLGHDDEESAAWPGMCIAWIKTMGFMDASE